MKKLYRLHGALVLAISLIVATALTACSWAETPVAKETHTPMATVEYEGASALVERLLPPPEPSPTETTALAAENKPQRLARYADTVISESELRELAAVVYLEAGNQSEEGQQAVVEVSLNRVISADFPDSVHDVLYQGAETEAPQFATIGIIDTAEPGQAQSDAINAALYGPAILPDDVVYFSTGGENDRVWGKIGAHVFCYGYVWK